MLTSLPSTTSTNLQTRVSLRYFATVKRNCAQSKQRRKAQCAQLERQMLPRPPKWLEDAPSAPAYLKRLRVASEPRLKARLDLATEYNYQAVNDGNVFVRGSKVVDLNQVNGDQTVTLKKTYDFLPSKQKNWVESPLKPDEYGDLLKKTGAKNVTFSPHPDGELGFSEFKAMKRLDDQRRRYDEELVAAQPDRYDSEQLSLERRSMFAPKVPLGLPDADVYARYFRDRLRGLEAPDDAIRERIRALESTAAKTAECSLDVSSRKGKRRSGRLHWRVHCYTPPTDLNALKTMLWKDVYVIFMNERQRLLQDSQSYNAPLWDALLERLSLRFRRCSLESSVAILSLLCDLDRSPDPGNKRFSCIQSLLRTCIAGLYPVPTPKLFTVLLLALGRCRLRIPAASLLDAFPTLWHHLNPNQLIQVANAVAQLGLAEHMSVKKLSAILIQLLMQQRRCPSLRKDPIVLYRRLSSVAALALLSEEGLHYWLQKCMENWETFPLHYRPLHIVELFLRLCRADVYAALPDEVKGFMEYVRLGGEENAPELCDTQRPRSYDSGQSSDDQSTWFPSTPAARKKSFLPQDAKSVRDVFLTMLQTATQSETIILNALAGPFVVPFFVPAQRLVVDLVCKLHCFKDTPALTPDVELRHLLLEKMGFRLCVINVDDFKAAQLKRSEWDYVSNKLQLKPFVPSIVDVMHHVKSPVLGS